MNSTLPPIIRPNVTSSDAAAPFLLDALPHPIIMIDSAGHIADANSAAQDFFQASIAVLRRQPIDNLRRRQPLRPCPQPATQPQNRQP